MALNKRFTTAVMQSAERSGTRAANSLGLGLSGTRRLADEFDIETEPGRGTKVTIRKWKREL